MARVQTTRETVSINIRAKSKQRDLIDQAAGRQGRSRLVHALHDQAKQFYLSRGFVLSPL